MYRTAEELQVEMKRRERTIDTRLRKRHTADIFSVRDLLGRFVRQSRQDSCSGTAGLREILEATGDEWYMPIGELG
jgi:hypothetical protein